MQVCLKTLLRMTEEERGLVHGKGVRGTVNGPGYPREFMIFIRLNLVKRAA